jgi:hypothetical protein
LDNRRTFKRTPKPRAIGASAFMISVKADPLTTIRQSRQGNRKVYPFSYQYESVPVKRQFDIEKEHKFLAFLSEIDFIMSIFIGIEGVLPFLILHSVHSNHGKVQANGQGLLRTTCFNTCR